MGWWSGALAQRIAEARGLDVVAIDINPEQIRLASSGPAKPNLQFLAMDATNLQFPDAQFDLVATVKTLNYILDGQRAFRKMAPCCVRAGTSSSWILRCPRGFRGKVLSRSVPLTNTLLNSASRRFIVRGGGPQWT
jgi:ubiquinone/menaquinone biosynthesis C-methylase UbiE